MTVIMRTTIKLVGIWRKNFDAILSIYIVGPNWWKQQTNTIIVIIVKAIQKLP